MITTEVKVFLFLFKFIPILLDMALNAFLKSLILGSELLVLLEGSPMPGTYSFKLLPKGLVARLQRSEILRFIHHKLYRLIMLKLPSATFTLLFLRTLSPFSRRRKDSHWIYSSQSEQMNHAHPGTITLSVLPPHPFDSTLRLYRAIQKAHIILAPNPASTLAFLKQLGQKKLSEETDDSSLSVYEGNNIEIAKSYELNSGNLNQAIELSKQLQMAVQIQKISQSNNDRQNRQLKQQQEKLIQFMQLSTLKNELQTFKSRNSGWPKVQALKDHLDSLNQWRKGGIDVLFMLSELQHQGSKSIFKYLQSEKLPYEILPTPNSLISTLAASGFPADRFAIEYFPSSLETLFSSRASMKMAIAIIISSNNLKRCFEEIIKAYGQLHLVYIQNEAGKMIGRGQIKELAYSLLKQLQPGNYRVVVAPYLSTFNEDLKEEKSKVSRLYGQAMHENTHFVRMEFITQQLYTLQSQKDPKNLLVHSLLQKMIGKGMPEDAIAAILCEVSGAKRQRMLQLIKQVKEGMTVDYIGLAELTKGK